MSRLSHIAVALVAGIAGALAGRVVSHGAAPLARAVDTAPKASGESCENADASTAKALWELGETKTQLRICLAYFSVAPAPSAARPEPERTHIRTDRHLLHEIPDAVIVRHSDGSIGIYPPDNLPSDGRPVAQKLRNGQIGWYGPQGDRPDPPVIERAPDGTITVDGQPASDAVQRMFGGVLDK